MSTYREEGLTVRKRRARRKGVGTRAPILVEARPNARWSLDFVHDQLANGRRLSPGGECSRFVGIENSLVGIPA
jgi:transposase InsO family protein